jgi:hypothetical protein
MHESLGQKDLVRASEGLLFVQWIHDASLRDTKYDFPPSSILTETMLTRLCYDLADYWVLNIAICTYSILANHKRLYGWLQDHPFVVCLWPWVLSIIWAVLGLVLAGYQNIGGCESPPPPAVLFYFLLTSILKYSLLVCQRPHSFTRQFHS